jgi:hypothetical protein
MHLVQRCELHKIAADAGDPDAGDPDDLRCLCQ